jgi:hypothetical protein
MLIFHATQYEIIINWFSTKIYDKIYTMEKIAYREGARRGLLNSVKDIPHTEFEDMKIGPHLILSFTKEYSNS